MRYLEGVKLKWTRQNLIQENQSNLVKIYLVCIEIYKVWVCTHKYCKLVDDLVEVVNHSNHYNPMHCISHKSTPLWKNELKYNH
jgi:hypothetical protein